MRSSIPIQLGEYTRHTIKIDYTSLYKIYKSTKSWKWENDAESQSARAAEAETVALAALYIEEIVHLQPEAVCWLQKRAK